MFNSTPISLPSACRHSWNCSTCYSGACSSECVAEVVFVVQSSQALGVSSHPTPTRGTVCAHVQCGLGCTSHLYQSLFNRNWVGGGRGCGGRSGVAVENCILNCEPLETLCRCVGMCVRCLQVDLPSFEHTHMHAIGKGIRHLRLLCFCFHCKLQPNCTCVVVP